jgi:UDP-N-acetylmuramoyl-tripeptide--D-alanyl-D-alanine ligase
MLWPLSKADLASILSSLDPIFHNCPDFSIKGCHFNSSSCEKNFLFFALPGQKTHGWSHRQEALDQGVSLILTDRSHVVKREPVCQVDDPYAAFVLLAKFNRQKLTQTKVVAIGGACGKTTTKELLTCLFEKSGKKVISTKQSQNGRLGVPLTLCQPRFSKNFQPDVLIVEIGIDQPGEMEKLLNIVQPNVSSLTSLGLEHTEGFGSIDVAIEEEKKLLTEKIIWNLNDPLIFEECFHHSKKGRVVFLEKKFVQLPEKQKNFLLENHSIDLVHIEIQKEFSYLQVTINANQPSQIKLYETNLPTIGEHLAQLGALAISIFYEVSKNYSIPSLDDFKGVKGRCEVIKKNECFVLNDSYNSNPLSLSKVLHYCFEQWPADVFKLFFLGDMLELGDYELEEHEKLALQLASFKKLHVVFVGTRMKMCKEKLLTLQKSDDLTFEHHLSSEFSFSSSVQNALKEETPHILIKGSRQFQMEKIIPNLISFIDSN